MKGVLSPMEDSTLSETVARQAMQGMALNRAIPSIDDCEVFGKALTEYAVASALVHSADNDPGVLYPIAGLVDQAATNMVIAAADYHCACVLFAAQRALRELDCEEA